MVKRKKLASKAMAELKTELAKHRMTASARAATVPGKRKKGSKPNRIGV
jgi:hypothetical protein